MGKWGAYQFGSPLASKKWITIDYLQSRTKESQHHIHRYPSQSCLTSISHDISTHGGPMWSLFAPANGFWVDTNDLGLRRLPWVKLRRVCHDSVDIQLIPKVKAVINCCTCRDHLFPGWFTDSLWIIVAIHHQKQIIIKNQYSFFFILIRHHELN